MARSCGLPFDLRKCSTYEVYSKCDFVSLLGKHGDSYDRYVLRVEEMKVSCQIILFCLNSMPYGDYNHYQKKASDDNNHMEAIISHFKHYFENLAPDPEFVYLPTEAPKGEFGVFFISDGTNKPFRAKFRAPGYFHLQGLPAMVKNNLLADLVTIIGTQDLVFGEIDR